jgi:DNA repair exonuclease SbcCD nuclease subunit
MRIAFCADIHVGNHKKLGGPIESGLNRRCQLIIDTLKKAVYETQQEYCDAFVVLGDLFDSTSPEPQIIAAVQKAIESRIPSYLLLGNHDQVSTAMGDNALAPLWLHGTVVEKPTSITFDTTSLLLVPFQPGVGFEWLPSAIDEAAKTARGKRKILGLHLGLTDDYTVPWLKDTADSIHVRKLSELCKKYEIEAVFAGNFHQYSSWKLEQATAYQVGTLVPTGFDDVGLERFGSLLIWDSVSGVKRVEIPGPRFVTFQNLTEFYKRLPELGSNIFVRVTASSDKCEEAVSAIAEAKNDGLILDGCVEPDKSAEQNAAQEAASSARSANTLEEALASFIANMPLPEGVNREKVVERARKYLAVSKD